MCFYFVPFLHICGCIIKYFNTHMEIVGYNFYLLPIKIFLVRFFFLYRAFVFFSACVSAWMQMERNKKSSSCATAVLSPLFLRTGSWKYCVFYTYKEHSNGLLLWALCFSASFMGPCQRYRPSHTMWSLHISSAYFFFWWLLSSVTNRLPLPSVFHTAPNPTLCSLLYSSAGIKCFGQTVMHTFISLLVLLKT